MRYCVLLCVLCATLSTNAQTWNLAAGAGLVINSKTSIPGVHEDIPNVPGGAAYIGVSYRRNRREAGISTSYRRYAVRHHGDFIFEDDFDPLTGTVKSVHHLDFLEKFPAISITPFARYHFENKKTGWFAGISAGYAVFPFQVAAVDPVTGKEYLAGPAPSGFTGGVHGGCNYKLNKRLALQSMLSIDDLWSGAFNLYGLMLTAGIRYSIR